MNTANIFTKASFIARAKQKAQEEDFNLLQAGKELAKEVALAYLLYYGLWTLVVLAFVGVLSFSSLLGGPYVLAQVLFFLLAGSLLLAVITIWQLWRIIKRQLKKLNPLDTESDTGETVRDAEVVDGRLADK